MPCHHSLEVEETGNTQDCRGPLFRTIARGTKQLSSTDLPAKRLPYGSPPCRRCWHSDSGWKPHR